MISGRMKRPRDLSLIVYDDDIALFSDIHISLPSHRCVAEAVTSSHVVVTDSITDRVEIFSSGTGIRRDGAAEPQSLVPAPRYRLRLLNPKSRRSA